MAWTIHNASVVISGVGLFSRQALSLCLLRDDWATMIQWSLLTDLIHAINMVQSHTPGWIFENMNLKKLTTIATFDWLFAFEHRGPANSSLHIWKCRGRGSGRDFMRLSFSRPAWFHRSVISGSFKEHEFQSWVLDVSCCSAPLLLANRASSCANPAATDAFYICANPLVERGVQASFPALTSLTNCEDDALNHQFVRYSLQHICCGLCAPDCRADSLTWCLGWFS